jgi:hypothetical protein
MKAPKVYAAINAITAELAKEGIAKRNVNLEECYAYRSIDDVYERLSPLLAKHRLCVLPRVLERTAVDRIGDGDQLLVNVTVRAAFDLVSVEDGSSHTVEAFAEALDGSDKATAKAMSSAYKHAMLQTFCVPVAGVEDADGLTTWLRTNGAKKRAAGRNRLPGTSHVPKPVQGWEQWVRDIRDMLVSCETPEAVQRVQNGNRELLQALRAERVELYAELGQAIGARRKELEASASQRLPGKGKAGSSGARVRRCSKEDGAVASKKARAQDRKAVAADISDKRSGGTAVTGRLTSAEKKAPLKSGVKASTRKPEPAEQTPASARDEVREVILA